MSRNGLFADDGRVSALASAVGRKTSELMSRIALLSDRATALEQKGVAHDDTLNSLDAMIKALKVRDTDLENSLEAKADRTALSALSSKVSGYYDANAVDDLLAGVNNSISNLAEHMLRVSSRAETRFGKVVQTNGFFNLSKQDRFIPVVLDDSTGGVTYDTSLGNGCLIVPETGFYDIKLTIFFSGGSGLGSGKVAMLQPGSSGWYNGVVLQLVKPPVEDMALSRSEIAYLPKGTKLAPVAVTPYLDGGISSWGDDRMIGTTLAVSRI